MDIHEILECNFRFNAALDQIEEQYSQLVSINNTIDIDEIAKLSYDEIKTIYKTLKNRIPDKTIATQLKQLYMAKRLEANPILADVHYFPQIKQLKQLTKAQQKELDNYLSTFNIGDFVFSPLHFWWQLNVPNSLIPIIKSFLCEQGILSKVYFIPCLCSDGGIWLDEATYTQYLDHMSLSTEKIAKMSKNEQKDHYNSPFCNLHVKCIECGGREITTAHALKSSSTVGYKLSQAPDFSANQL